MKVKYIGDFPLSSVQKSFIPNSDEIHDLNLEDGNYLLKTFSKLFEVVEDKETKAKEIKPETKVEIQEETPKKSIKK